MILRILSFLFPQVRELERAIEIMDRSRLETKAITDDRIEFLETMLNHWRDRTDRAESRAIENERELVKVLKTAGDSLGLRVTGRRMFSKAPVEAPPSEESRQPVNLSPGAGRQFAGDVARKRSADFIDRIAREAGVIKQDQKPN